VEGVQLEVANGLWVDSDFSIKPQFVKQAEALLAETRNVDLATKAEETRQVINGWVEEKTHNKIKELLPAGCGPGSSPTS
jgi:serpin B